MKSIEERVAEIKDKHTRGYNCAQIVLCSYAEELGIDEETLFRISEGFGAGMGGMMQTCGAVDWQTVREICRPVIQSRRR